MEDDLRKRIMGEGPPQMGDSTLFVNPESESGYSVSELTPDGPITSRVDVQSGGRIKVTSPDIRDA